MDSYRSDIEAIISKRHDQGADLWATPDKRIYKGAPFSTLESLLMLTELEPVPTPIMQEGAAFILSLLQSKTIDGKIVVEHPNNKLANFYFCKKGVPSEWATHRYQEIWRNIQPAEPGGVSRER